MPGARYPAQAGAGTNQTGRMKKTMNRAASGAEPGRRRPSDHAAQEDAAQADVPSERAALERAVLDAVAPDERAAALYDLGRLLYSEDLARLGAMLDEIQYAAEQVHDDELLARVFWLRGVYQRDTSTGDFGMEAFRRSHEISRAAGDLDASASAILHMSRIHDRRGDYRGAIAVLAQSLELTDRLGADQRAQIYTRLGINYLELGDLPNAHAHALRAMEAAENGDSNRLNVYALVGGIYHRMGMYAKARDIVLRALEFTDTVGGGMAQLNNMGAIEAALGNGRAALDYMDRALRSARARKAPHLIVQALANRAAVLESLGRSARAERDAREALAGARPIGDRGLEALALGTLGRILAGRGDHAGAVALLKEALEIFTAIGRRPSESMAHRHLADSYAALGRTALSLKHLRIHVAMHEEIYNPSKLDAMADVLYALEHRRAEQEREILRLRAAELEREMERTNAELTAQALHLVEKREFLEAIQERLRAALAEASPAAATALEALERDIRGNLSADSEWETFEEQFTRVHGAFLAELQRGCPALSGAELKICALTRINLDTKEIARLLSASVRTVQNHRYNIRRKLGLEERESLAQSLGRIAAGSVARDA